MQVRTLAAAAVITLSLTSACGGSGATETTGNDAPKASQGESKTDTKDLDTFFRAVAEGDSDDLEGVRKLVSPGSLAEAYLDYSIQSDDVAVDAGYEPFLETEYKKTGDTWQACAVDDGSTCVEFADVETESGKIADFTVAGTAIAEKLVKGDGSKVDAGSVASIEFLSASKTSNGNLVVIYKIFSKGDDITLGTYEAKYRDPSGRQSTASSDSAGPDELAADSSATVLAVLPKAKPGGEITVPVYDEDYNEATAKFRIK